MIEPRQHGHLSIDNSDIYYRIYGHGEKSLLLLHGNGEDWTCFTSLIEVFSKSYTVITMDSRGHGKSNRGDKPITLKQIAKDALQLLRLLKIYTVSVIGFSDGANVAIEMILHSNFSFERLILAGGNLDPQGVRFQYQFPVILSHRFYEILARINPGFTNKADIIGLMVHEPNITPQSLRRITCPTLVLAGEHDMIKRRHTILIANSIPDSKLIIIPKADHFIFGKWAKITNHAIEKFLSDD